LGPSFVFDSENSGLVARLLALRPCRLGADDIYCSAMGNRDEETPQIPLLGIEPVGGAPKRDKCVLDYVIGEIVVSHHPSRHRLDRSGVLDVGLLKGCKVTGADAIA
jgi:hypothetical protein